MLEFDGKYSPNHPQIPSLDALRILSTRERKPRQEEKQFQNDPTFLRIYCAPSATLYRKDRYTIQKSISSRKKGGCCLLEVCNRKLIPFYWKKILLLQNQRLVNLQTNKFCKCITKMASDFIVFPKTEQETAQAIIRFTEFSNCKIPPVVGAIDGIQIEVIGLSTDSKMDYFNMKQHYSIITQAAIGANLFFLDLAAGFPGSVHNSCLLRHSTLYQNSEQEKTLSMPQRHYIETYFVW